MSSNDNDEAVSQFMAFTGSSDASQAQSYLEMSGNNLETAVSLYLEHQGSGGGSSSGTGATSSSTGGMTGNDANMEVRAPDQTRRMRLMDYDTNMNMTHMGAGLMDHSVLGAHMRASMRGLHGNADAGGSGSNVPLSMMNAFAADEDMNMNMNVGDEAEEDIPTSLREVMNRAAMDDAMDMHDHILPSAPPGNTNTATNTGTGGTNSTSSNRPARLSDMFAPPLHLIHSAGGFMGARNVAKDTRRWLLVNLNSDADFACHALNRDVWRDELCENLIREGFVFWQTEDTTDDGRTYCQRYNVTSFPHIGIIDPRTARLMYRKEGWTMEKPLLPEAFAEMAADFCSRHSFDKAPVAPKIGGGSSASGGNGGGIMSSSGGGGGSGSRMVSNQSSVGEMTEEQQLQAAIRASMNDAAGAGTSAGANDYQPYDDDDDDESVEYIMPDDDSDVECSMEDNEVQIMDSGTSAQEAEPEPEPEPKEPSFMEQIIAMDVGEEPSDKAARVMIRMPDGKRLVRRFKMDDTVKIIYAFVAQSSEDAKGGKEFVIKAGFPPKDLLGSVDESIASSGLAGDSITVRWMED